MGQEAFFNGWTEVARTVAVGVAAYGLLVAMLRLSGKRTLSKLNAFDFVVTVALGSTLATVLLSREVSLTKGLVAMALLIGLQFAVTWTSVRWDGFNRFVKSEPTVLLRHGRPIGPAMRRERVTEDELMSAIRENGGQSLSEAEVVILDSDGTLTAILRREAGG